MVTWSIQYFKSRSRGRNIQAGEQFQNRLQVAVYCCNESLTEYTNIVLQMAGSINFYNNILQKV